MTLTEARELVASPLWPKVRDLFRATGTFNVYPRGDVRRIEYLAPETRAAIDLWKKALCAVHGWRTIVDGAKVRALRAEYPGVYPEVLRYAAYFPKAPETPEAEAAFTLKLLKLKFPEAYALCCS